MNRYSTMYVIDLSLVGRFDPEVHRHTISTQVEPNDLDQSNVSHLGHDLDHIEPLLHHRSLSGQEGREQRHGRADAPLRAQARRVHHLRLHILVRHTAAHHDRHVQLDGAQVAHAVAQARQGVSAQLIGLVSHHGRFSSASHVRQSKVLH